MLWPNAHHCFRRQFSAYLDGQLSAAQEEALADHMAGCAACRQEVEELRAMTLALQELPLAQVPRPFALTPEQAGRPAPPRRPPVARAFPIGARLAGAALACALALVLVIDLSGLGGRQDGQSSAGPLAAQQAMQERADKGEEGRALDLAQPASVPSPAGEQEPASPAAGRAEEGPDILPSESPSALLRDRPLGESEGGIDPLRAAEIALGSALAALVAGSLSLAVVRRRL